MNLSLLTEDPQLRMQLAAATRRLRRALRKDPGYLEMTRTADERREWNDHLRETVALGFENEARSDDAYQRTQRQRRQVQACAARLRILN